MMIPNQKNTDFKYFQSGLGFIYNWNKAFKPRFIYTCSRFLFDSKINDPYRQLKDAIGFLNYIFKGNKKTKLPSRQEIANIVSIAQLIKDGYETYTRTTNELSISLNKAGVSKRWKEIYGVNKKTAQLDLARGKVDHSKRKGKKYFPDLIKKELRDTRTKPIARNRKHLKDLKKQYELLQKTIRELSPTNTSYRRTMDKADSVKWEIIRLERTLENVDPNLIQDTEFNRVRVHIQKELQRQNSMAYSSSDSITDIQGGTSTPAGTKRAGIIKEKVDWTGNVSGDFARSSKHINMSETIYDTTTKKK